MTAGTNQFVPFATGTGANVYSAAAYSGLPARATGVVGGVANSAAANNAWRQGTSMSAMLGQFIAAHGYDALDDGDIATLKAHFEAALSDMIAAAVPDPDLSPYLLKAGGELIGGGHISDPVDPSHENHLVRLGYLASQLSALGAGRFMGLSVITASGTWTRPTGVTKALVFATGGGAAGGYDGSSGSSVWAGGGGAGATAITIVDLSAVSTVPCVVGAGGTGYSGYIGSNGGATSFGTFAVAGGGNGGGIDSGGHRFGGQGGVATSGDILLGGGGGGGGSYATGGGGASFWGGGGAENAVFTGQSANANAYGAGGAAGAGAYGTNGNGGNGVIFIIEFA